MILYQNGEIVEKHDYLVLWQELLLNSIKIVTEPAEVNSLVLNYSILDLQYFFYYFLTVIVFYGDKYWYLLQGKLCGHITNCFCTCASINKTCPLVCLGVAASLWFISLYQPGSPPQCIVCQHHHQTWRLSCPENIYLAMWTLVLWLMLTLKLEVLRFADRKTLGWVQGISGRDLCLCQHGARW